MYESSQRIVGRGFLLVHFAPSPGFPMVFIFPLARHFRELFFRRWWKGSKFTLDSPPKINIEPEHGELEDDFPSPGVYSQVPC